MLAIPWASNCLFYNLWKFLAVDWQMVALNEAQEMWNIRKSHLLKKDCSVGETKNTKSSLSHTQDKFKIPEKKVKYQCEKERKRMHLLHCSALVVSAVLFFYCWLHFIPIFSFPLLKICLFYNYINIFSVPAVMWFVQTAVQMFPPVHKWVFAFVFSLLDVIIF